MNIFLRCKDVFRYLQKYKIYIENKLFSNVENKISKLEFPVEEPGNSSIIYTKDVENRIKCETSKTIFSSI